MNKFSRKLRGAVLGLLAAGPILLAGCDSGGGYKHDPPPGEGCIIVDVQSSDIVHVYINGIYANDVGDYDYEAYDLDPGMYRVVLDQKNGSHSYSHDVDVIEGKRTVLQVYRYEGSWEYDVRIFYD
jgi:hypothetical protein